MTVATGPAPGRCDGLEAPGGSYAVNEIKFLFVQCPHGRLSAIQSEGTFMAIAENKPERIEVRTTPNAKASIRQAAA